MTEEHAPYHAEPEPSQAPEPSQGESQTPRNGEVESIPEMQLPETPITEKTLEYIVIPKPASGNTLTRYVMTDGERYAKFEELTAEEREIVLKFILKYAAPLVVNRRPRRIEQVCDIDFDTSELERLLDGK